MKKFISIIVAFMLILILIGCATMSSEERKETYDLQKSVGDSTFVGDSSPSSRAAFNQVYSGRM
jgi:ABC-type uncharacterized transport system auxiliary subunit